ncbi:MAG: cadmium-translocating P-type ATPase [Paracoccaceae bacterium]
MSLAETPSAGACPGCTALPETAKQSARKAGATQSLELSLPGIHCAGCIAAVERGLLKLPDVRAARVNLSQKRVRIDTSEEVAPETLIDHLAGLGYEARHLDSDLLGPRTDQTGRDLMMRLAVAGFAMMNVMLLSVAVWSGAADATRDLFHWISATIALPTIAFSAQPFFRNAMSALKAMRLNMDVPISLAIILAGGMSVYETAAGGHHAYFDAALSLTFFLLIGRYLDHRSRAAARSAAAQLAALEVPRVIRLTDGRRETVNLSEVAVGDVVAVLPGGRIPVDGIITEGTSDIDRSLLTGESLPEHVTTADAVSAGELNLSGPLTLRATAVGADTTLRRMATMIDAAESSRNRYTALADRAAAIYAPAVHLLALVAFIGWLLASGDVRLSLNIAIAVLIITCPCALGLAVPAVATAAAGRLFRNGMLVKDGTALERLSEVDTIVFDKTGTLTESTLIVDRLDGIKAEHLSIAAALAQASSHPVARAIAEGLAAEGIPPARVENITEVPGHGTEGSFNGETVRLGSPEWAGASEAASQATGAGSLLQLPDATSVFLGLDSKLRPGAEDALQALARRGYQIHLISGDRSEITQAVACKLGISDVHANMRPDAKIGFVKDLTAAGRKVLMVGDGLNDTGALAAAYASVSPASAADASRTASDVVLLHDSLAPLSDLLDTSQSARRRVLENFSIAAGYNAIAIPVALAGFATPLAAAIAMSASSITVLLNALRVRGRLRGATGENA